MVILPDSGKGPFPVFYLLHGLSDDQTIWQRRTSLERYAQGYPMIVVLPDGFRGFYTANTAGPDYAKYIAHDLTDVIERTFPAKSARSARCIGGLSMGGYGAFRLALGYPDRYISAHSHSGALLHGGKKWTKDNAEFQRVFGPNPKGSDHDLLNLVNKAQSAGKLPKLRIDCGTEDFLLQDNRDYHKALVDLNIPHQYEEHPGAHNWDYWDTHIQSALAFHAKNLKIKRA